MSNVAMNQLLKQSAAMHHHLCPRQVLGVRMGMLAGTRLNLDLPQRDKRLLVFMETDGCTADGVSVASGAWVGRRTMRMVDFGKVAATFFDTDNGAAVRIHPHPASRSRAIQAAPTAPDRWHAQLLGYQRLPDEDLLIVEMVSLAVDPMSLVSREGARSWCSACGEEISNEREVVSGDHVLCRACAGDAYYVGAARALFAAGLSTLAVIDHAAG